MLANGVYGMSAITALTAQNTLGVSGSLEVPPQFLKQQLDAVFTDIFPDAVKIGMVSSAPLIGVIADALQSYHAMNIVVDPVLISSSGRPLLEHEALTALMEKLFPLATLVTPNIPEAELMSGSSIESREEMLSAARKIQEKYHCAVLCKGGHRSGDADDLLVWEEETFWFSGKRIENPNTHGTGCTLSSAIAANLAKGEKLPSAVAHAKEYITQAIGAMLDLGAGSGPMDHGYMIPAGAPFSGKLDESVL